jgi:hypothetical protein
MRCPRGDTLHTHRALTATVTAQDARSLVVVIDLMSLRRAAKISSTVSKSVVSSGLRAHAGPGGKGYCGHRRGVGGLHNLVAVVLSLSALLRRTNRRDRRAAGRCVGGLARRPTVLHRG